MKSFLFLAALRLSAQCLPAEGEFILARQFATANPAFAKLPPDTPLGRSSVAGMRRIYSVAEIARIAAAHGLLPERYTGMCFQWPLIPLQPDRVLDTMRRSL